MTVLFSVVAFAQNTPQWELFTGYQFTRTDIGAFQDLANSLTVPANLPNIDVGRNLNVNGGNLSLQENRTGWWGGMVDFSGSYASKHIDLSQVAQAAGFVPPGTTVIATFRPTIYTITGGPQFTYRKHERMQPFARLWLA
jgi:hypothetical protein